MFAVARNLGLEGVGPQTAEQLLAEQRELPPRLSDERRRMARELHDSASQLLVALQLQLGQLKRCGVPRAEPLIDEMEQLVRDIQESIRKVSLSESDEDEGADGIRVRIASMFHSLGSPIRPVC